LRKFTHGKTVKFLVCYTNPLKSSTQMLLNVATKQQEGFYRRFSLPSKRTWSSNSFLEARFTQKGPFCLHESVLNKIILNCLNNTIIFFLQISVSQGTTFMDLSVNRFMFPTPRYKIKWCSFVRTSFYFQDNLLHFAFVLD
jgi:hypothetical protein